MTKPAARAVPEESPGWRLWLGMFLAGLGLFVYGIAAFAQAFGEAFREAFSGLGAGLIAALVPGGVFVGLREFAWWVTTAAHFHLWWRPFVDLCPAC